ncbi:MAG: alpha/beta fold hydrolase [Erythrobacter sp.]
MTARDPLAELKPQLLATKSEIARRFALAGQQIEDPAPRPKFWQFLGEAEVFAEVLNRPMRKIPIAQAKNPRTVMVLPGFMTHPVRMRFMTQHLDRAGHHTKRWGQGFNFGPTEENFAQLEERLLGLYEQAGEPIVLLGWSLGGVFARELAKKQPHAVAKVITMGSPFSGDPRSNNVWRVYQLVTGHQVDNPPVVEDVAAKPPVETVAMWSPRDGMIAPRAACGMAHERDRAIALRCTHIGFSYSKEAIVAVLEELERG